jgi:hypothetical protein
MQEREEKNNAQADYCLRAIQYQLEFGESGEEIVRMVTQYIAEGWMDWEGGLMMLRAIFEPEPDDSYEH